MDSLCDWLYIGKYRETLDAIILRQYAIEAMLQLAEAVAQPGVESLYLPVEDGLPLDDHLLRRGVDFALAQKQLRRKVLVACGAGMSRSAAFAVAILKEAERISLVEALRQVKSQHPETLIHPALWESLCKFYAEDAPLQLAISIMHAEM